MKHLLLVLASMMLLVSVCACVKDPVPEQEEEQKEPTKPVKPEDDNGPDVHFYTIVQLWQISMRREIPYPFKVYVLQINNGKWFYLRRLSFDGELHVGDEIAFSIYYKIPDEISSIDYLIAHNGEQARVNAMSPGIGTYLVASDPIEADVKDMFILNMRYALPFTPIETVVIETTDGNLIYVKSSKLPETDSADLTIGDHFVYNVYTIFPNEVVAIKKLR